MTKMTHRISLPLVAKLVNLHTSHIYSHNHRVGMDNIFSNANLYKTGTIPNDPN
jgi:hypothetical protein